MDMATTELLHERLTEGIIGAFYEVYNALGYGFVEKVYVSAMVIELEHRGLAVRREVRVNIHYRDRFACAQQVDLLAVNEVVVEVKAAEDLPAIAIKQCRSYLRALSLPVGLVLNFGPKPQIKRIVCLGDPLGPEVKIVLPKSASSDPGPTMPEG
jgi:GxxExxY protein